jgi:hypothetical protein
VYFLINPHVPLVVTDGFSVPDDVLGWAPPEGMRAHAVEQAPADPHPNAQADRLVARYSLSQIEN